MPIRSFTILCLSFVLSCPAVAASYPMTHLCPFDYITHEDQSTVDATHHERPQSRIDTISQLHWALHTNLSPDKRGIVIRADQIAQNHQHTLLLNHIAVLNQHFVIHADKALYSPRKEILDTQSPTFFQTTQFAVRAQTLHIHLRDHTAEFTGVTYQVNNQKAYRHKTQHFISSGKGRSIVFSDNQYIIQDATYSTCPIDHPLWFISARTIIISPDDNDIVIKNARFHLKNTTIFYLPVFHFPLHNSRTTGFLTPLYAQNEKTGFSFALPYYFNLSENYDFTLTPYFMEKIGLSLQGHFRLLTKNSQLSLKTEYLAVENKRKNARYAIDIQGFRRMNPHWTIRTRVSHVSDSAYFRDIVSQVGSLSTILLPSYFDSEWYFDKPQGFDHYQLFIQKYQLAYAADPHDTYSPRIALPYAILPRFEIHYLRYGHGPIPWRLSLSTKLTQFEDSHTHRWDAWRAVIRPQLRTYVRAGPLVITPTIGAQSTYDAITIHGKPSTIVLNDHAPSTTVPYFSADLMSQWGLRWSEGSAIWTIQPHAYYLFIPHNRSILMPNFDSAPIVPNFANFYTHYLLTGSDQLPAANQLTAGIDFSIWHPQSGHLSISGSIAERYYWRNSYANLSLYPYNPQETPFDQRRPTLLNKKNTTDDLLQLHTYFTKHLLLSTHFQWGRGHRNPHHGLYRWDVLGSYYGDNQHIISTGLTYQRKGLTEIGLSGVFPVARDLFGIAAIHYVLNDHTDEQHHAHFFSNSILGLQYINCCLAATLIFTYTRSPLSQPVNAVYLRFTIGGLGQIGQNKTGLLEYEIPGYHDPIGNPNF